MYHSLAVFLLWFGINKHTLTNLHTHALKKDTRTQIFSFVLADPQKPLCEAQYQAGGLVLPGRSMCLASFEASQLVQI
jgi:hypothetical protein